MSQQKFAFSFTLLAALLVATPAVGQLINAPVLALAYGDGDPVNNIAGQWGRGLNSDSGETGIWTLGYTRSQQRFSFQVSGGYVMGDVTEFTYGGQAAFHLVGNPDGAQASIQGGVGYLKVSTDDEEATTYLGYESRLRYPIGLALEARPSEFGRIWIFPRMDFSRTKNTVDETKSVGRFGLSMGASIASDNGWGIDAAFDFIDLKDSAPIKASIGLSYNLP